MINIKDKVLNIALCNTKLMAFIYDNYKKNVEKELQHLIYEMAEIDTIKDVEPLIELKKQITEKGRKFVSYNGNKSNFRLYGIGNALFAEYADNIYMTPSIEHGLIFYNQNWTDTSLTARASCVTFGEFRKKILQRYYKTPVFEVGPYIQYAADYYTKEQMYAWKERLGKTLLVFPMHSTDDSVLSYDNEMYIDEIEKRAKNYDSVIVCVFWWNLDDCIVHEFASKGYYIASAGYREDPKFLSRQKAMIEVADHIISDSIGTHIGYCYKLGKQVEFVTMETEFQSKEETSDKEIYNLEQRKIIKDVIQSGNNSKIELTMNYYWGNNISLTRNQLNAIAEINKDITIAGRYWTNRYEKIIPELLAEYKDKSILKYNLLKDSLNV